MGAAEEIPVGSVYIHTVFIAPAVQVGLHGELPPLTVAKVFVAGVRGGSAHVAGVRTVVFKNIEPRFAHEFFEFLSVAYAPVAGFLPRLGPVAATPPPPAKNAYNVTVQGRVYVDNQLQAGVKLITCVNGVTTTTDKGGVFRFELPAGTAYCVRVNDGLPAGSRLLRTNNNPEHAAASSYESQAAAKNYYHDLWQFFTTNYSWDRNSDENVDFFYATP